MDHEPLAREYRTAERQAAESRAAAQRALERALVTIHRLRLTERDPTLAVMIKSLGNNGRLDQLLKERIIQTATSAEQALTEQPFLLAPPILIGQGNLLLGTQHDQSNVCISLNGELNRHMLITGASGSGKSNEGLSIIAQVLAGGLHCWIFNPKGDADAITTAHEDFLRLHPHFRWNPLLPLPGMTIAEHTILLIRTLAQTNWGGETTKVILAEALRKLYATHERPSLADLLRVIKELYTKTETYNRREAILGIAQKLERIHDQYPGIFTCHDGIPTTTIMEHCLDIPATMLSEPDQFLTTLLVHLLFEYCRRSGQRDQTTHLLIVEEGLHLLAASANRIDPHPPLASIWMMGREFGLALLCVATSPSLLSTTITSSAYTQLAMSMTDAKDTDLISRTMGLDRAQHEYLNKKIMTGQGILRLGGRWRDPLLLTTPHVLIDKTVTSDQLQRAIARTDSYAPPLPVPLALTTTPSDKPKERILNASEQGLLAHVTKVGITLVTDASTALGYHPMILDRARQTLTKPPFEFLVATRVVCRAGRGGTGIALEATTAAYDYLHRKPPHRTRAGDSVQHRFLVMYLARHLQDAVIEHQFGNGKSTDLLVRITPAHERLRTTLATHGQALGTNPPKIEDGMLVALEVEVSTPEVTSIKNVLANPVALTIIATFKHRNDTITALEQGLPVDTYEHVLVIDALTLLDELRGCSSPRPEV